ncbi:MAG TPA: prenyltransferase/squalene oxidase repeat-containing protein [Humisphaera sp.]
MTRATRLAALVLAAAAAAAVPAFTSAAPAPAAPAASADSPAVAKANATIEKGLQALKAMQKPDGGWQADKEPPAISAVVLRAFVQQPGYSNKTDFVAKGYEKLLSYQLDNGGIYADLLANYNTSISLSALAAAKDPAYQPHIDKAVKYLKGIQWTENAAGPGPKGEKVNDKSNPWYGGFGYSTKGRPDLSNTQMTLDALKDAGLKPDDPAFQAALVFASRTQNKTETNDQKFATDDGGFIYTSANDGESMAGEYNGPDGKRLLRSYGSMTYAGLKSMLYAGLTKDDPRVKSAWDWIGKNWTLDENPGMKLNNPDAAKNGLFYYYHTLARALNAYNEPVITDAKGEKHDWRLELIDKLAGSQKPDGSWEGVKKWQEDKPVLATAYSVLALQEAVKDLKENPPAK